MELLKQLIDSVLHLDKHLHNIIETLGPWAYVIFLLVIFCETGLVVTPFRPGDSFLFALGAIAATGSSPDLTLLIVLLSVAAMAGDTVNYWTGYFIGPKVFKSGNVRFLNKKHLDQTHAFYERYGGKTIIIARFVPIIRTFAPFVAGIGRMIYIRFMTYNAVGGILCIVSMTLAGYFFGSFPIVKNNFTLVVLAIIRISLLPAVIEFLRERKRIQTSQL
ncbi:MAG: DedA family protein [Verrucomicrobia bacterium]|nr:DedA family protein [Verrucomicrobiota bacterium]